MGSKGKSKGQVYKSKKNVSKFKKITEEFKLNEEANGPQSIKEDLSDLQINENDSVSSKQFS